MMVGFTRFAGDKWYSDGERCRYVINAETGRYRLACTCCAAYAYYDTWEAAQQAAEMWDGPDSFHLVAEWRDNNTSERGFSYEIESVQ